MNSERELTKHLTKFYSARVQFHSSRISTVEKRKYCFSSKRNKKEEKTQTQSVFVVVSMENIQTNLI